MIVKRGGVMMMTTKVNLTMAHERAKINHERHIRKNDGTAASLQRRSGSATSII